MNRSVKIRKSTTKKDFIDAHKDVPGDAEIIIEILPREGSINNGSPCNVVGAFYQPLNNQIILNVQLSKNENVSPRYGLHTSACRFVREEVEYEKNIQKKTEQIKLDIMWAEWKEFKKMVEAKISKAEKRNREIPYED